MHLHSVTIKQNRFPSKEAYPFNLSILQYTHTVDLSFPIMNEPEAAISPQMQLALLDLLTEMSRSGHAQFIISTHSPILMSCPQAIHYSFDHTSIERINYTETQHYKVYANFFRT